VVDSGNQGCRWTWDRRRPGSRCPEQGRAHIPPRGGGTVHDGWPVSTDAAGSPRPGAGSNRMVGGFGGSSPGYHGRGPGLPLGPRKNRAKWGPGRPVDLLSRFVRFQLLFNVLPIDQTRFEKQIGAIEKTQRRQRCRCSWEVPTATPGRSASWVLTTDRPPCMTGSGPRLTGGPRFVLFWPRGVSSGGGRAPDFQMVRFPGGGLGGQVVEGTARKKTFSRGRWYRSRRAGQRGGVVMPNPTSASQLAVRKAKPLAR